VSPSLVPPQAVVGTDPLCSCGTRQTPRLTIINGAGRAAHTLPMGIEAESRKGSNMIRMSFVACSAALLSSHAVAQDAGIGAREYMIACAGCHGESGKGDGPIAGLLEIDTPDLTQLTEHAGGVFPYEETLRMIDGRNEVRAHGSQMPVWGDRFFVSAATSDGPDPVQAELMAKGRMIALVGYLRSIQGE